jgi:hypothetical protein
VPIEKQELVVRFGPVYRQTTAYAEALHKWVAKAPAKRTNNQPDDMMRQMATIMSRKLLLQYSHTLGKSQTKKQCKHPIDAKTQQKGQTDQTEQEGEQAAEIAETTVNKNGSVLSSPLFSNPTWTPWNEVKDHAHQNNTSKTINNLTHKNNRSTRTQA